MVSIYSRETLNQNAQKSMTVGELIGVLSELDKDTVVLVDGYEDGYDDISSIDDVKVFEKNTYASWEGKYGDIRYSRNNAGLSEFKAVLISRGGAYA